MGPLSVGDLMESTVYPFSRMYSLFIEFPTRWIIMHIWKWKACISLVLSRIFRTFIQTWNGLRQRESAGRSRARSRAVDVSLASSIPPPTTLFSKPMPTAPFRRSSEPFSCSFTNAKFSRPPQVQSDRPFHHLIK